MGLFGPKWKSNNEQKALEGLRSGIFQIDQLIEICCAAPLASVRLAAFDKLASHGVWTWNNSKQRRDADLKKAAAGVLEKIQEPEQRIKLIRETKEPVLKNEAALHIPKASLPLLLPEMSRFSGEELITLAERFEDDRLTLETAHRLRGWKDPRLIKLLKKYADNKSTEEILALLQENPNNLAMAFAFLDRIPNDMEKVNRALETYNTELLEYAGRLVVDPAARKYAGEKLEERHDREKRDRISFVMSSSNGNFSTGDIDLFTDPKDIHDAYVLAREAEKNLRIGREAYEKLLNKLTYPKDIDRAIMEYNNPVGADGLEKLWGAENTWAWRKLSEMNDQGRLQNIAKNAKAQIVRWKACKLAGGHFFPKKGNLCRCEVCGFEKHPAPEGLTSGQAYQCRRCRGLVEAIPFSNGLPHATVSYPDGTRLTINGYDGLQYHEEMFAKKNDLF